MFWSVREPTVSLSDFMGDICVTHDFDYKGELFGVEIMDVSDIIRYMSSDIYITFQPNDTVVITTDYGYPEFYEFFSDWRCPHCGKQMEWDDKLGSERCDTCGYVNESLYESMRNRITEGS